VRSCGLSKPLAIELIDPSWRSGTLGLHVPIEEGGEALKVVHLIRGFPIEWFSFG